MMTFGSSGCFFVAACLLPMASLAFAPIAPPIAFNTRCYATAIDTSFMWNAGLNFGKGQFKVRTHWKILIIQCAIKTPDFSHEFSW